jgi:hypothetical protein
MTLSSSHYLTVDVPYAHLLPECRPQQEVSFPSADDPKLLAFCIVLENLSQFDFRELTHHPMEMNTSTI